MSYSDSSEIVPGMWVGRAPPPGDGVALADFHLLVLCANQNQAPELYPGVEILLAGIDDDQLSPGDIAKVNGAADIVARALRERRKTLVTCQMGLNRSALVAALALRLAVKIPGRAARSFVQRRRPGSLFNPWFASYLDGLPPP